ncbi:MAG: U32 family peptidase [Candidatus Firestonebacteria bacterium]|nr:U32 family peptidase [Candidatus Firestonebacteria bacterium]
MQLVVPTNWDDRLIEKLKKFPIALIYAKFKRDAFGGGRPAAALPEVTKKQASLHIRKIHDAGIKFNYVLNTTCMGNREFIKSYQETILREIEWIIKNRVEYVTVSIPYLMELIKKNFPELNIVASVFLNIDSIQKALFYKNLGVKEIVIDQSQNRNLKFLDTISKAIHVDLQLVVNNICLLYCPFRLYHQNINSHSSQYDRGSTKDISDLYPTVSCESIRINHPEEIIKSAWIRPEDLTYYEKIGIKHFKISGRTKSTDWIAKTVESYALRKSPDNIAELLSFPIAQNLPKVNIEIKNKYFGNFLNGFKNKDCRYIQCIKCRYCSTIALKALVINSDEVKRVNKKYRQILDNLAV